MKPFFLRLSFLPLLLLLVACGGSDSTNSSPSTAGAAATTCPANYVYSPQYGCAPANTQAGYPPGYNPSTYQPINGVSYPTGYNSCYYEYCQTGYEYEWYYYNGMYYYWIR